MYLQNDYLIKKTLLDLQEQIQADQEELKRYPLGKLTYSKTGKYIKYFVSIDGEQTYIPKKSRNLAVQLANKKYIQQRIAENQTIFKLLSQELSKFKISSEDILANPAYYDLLKSRFELEDPSLYDWMISKYEKNHSYPETLIFKCASGNVVRSKSESLIDTFLFQNKIPYRYECALEIDNVIVFPDFTIMHPYSKKIIYWEHFGMMDDAAYRHSALSKLDRYASAGIIPDVNLITTYETLSSPLSTRTIEQKIEQLLGL